MRGFKVPQSVIKSDLKHAPLTVYLYLLSKQKGSCVDVTYGQLAEVLELSAKTVFNSVRELTSKGYITAEPKKRNGRIAAMLFRIIPQPCHKWVWVESKLFELHLKASELKVYLYIKCRANHMGRAWPSAASISKDTGLSEETVRRAIRGLSASSLLCRKSTRRKCNCFGNNEYTAMSCADRELIMITLRKKKARTRKLRRKLQNMKINLFRKLAYHLFGKESIDLLPLIRC